MTRTAKMPTSALARGPDWRARATHRDRTPQKSPQNAPYGVVGDDGRKKETAHAGRKTLSEVEVLPVSTGTWPILHLPGAVDATPDDNDTGHCCLAQTRMPAAR